MGKGLKIIEGKFKVKISRKKYEEDAIQHAIKMKDIPGLVWKIWAFDEEKSEAMGIYYFRDDDMAQLVFDSMDPRTWPDFTYDIEMRIWDVQEELCKINRVPL